MNDENFEDDFEIEEDANKPRFLKKEMRAIGMKKAFAVVLGLHILAIIGIVFFSSQPKAVAQDDKRFLENLPQVGVEHNITTPEATPSPTPIPKVIIIHPKEISKEYPQYTKEYTVKKGDTFQKIVKIYGLNYKKLKSINNIKDENKIYVGQILKLM